MYLCGYGMAQSNRKQGPPVLLQHRNKRTGITAAVMISFVWCVMIFLVALSINATHRKSHETTAVIATVHANKSSIALHSQRSTSKNYTLNYYDDCRCPNTSSQPRPSPSPSPRPAPKPTCFDLAHRDQPTEQEIKALLGHQLRPLPSTDSSSPVLSTSNWEGLASEEHAGLNRSRLTELCNPYVFRYRVVSGVVYADHAQKNNIHYTDHRVIFVEMLLTSIWLYKSFPDVDLWISYMDHPARCNLSVPVLQYTIIGLDTVQKSKISNAVQVLGGSTVDVAYLATGHRQERSDLPTEVQFHRGWALNWPAAWGTLSFMPSVLQRYQRCLMNKAGGRPSIPKMIWRGSNTGGDKGWGPVYTSKSSPVVDHPWGWALGNKRMALALMARSHSWMDVGLSSIVPDWMGNMRANDQQLVKTLKQLMIRGWTDLEEWGKYVLQLSIDGNGSADRLPRQYLQGSSVVVKVESPYKDAFEELFKPGEHYEPVRYDLSDLVTRGQELLTRFNESGSATNDNTPMRRMAAASASKALEIFSFLGQLDVIAYAAQKVKSVSKWEVQKPRLLFSSSNASAPDPKLLPEMTGWLPDGYWEVVKLERKLDGSNWHSPSLKMPWADGIRKSITTQLAVNFEVS